MSMRAVLGIPECRAGGVEVEEEVVGSLNRAATSRAYYVIKSSLPFLCFRIFSSRPRTLAPRRFKIPRIGARLILHACHRGQQKRPLCAPSSASENNETIYTLSSFLCLAQKASRPDLTSSLLRFSDKPKGFRRRPFPFQGVTNREA